jgi:hypothetical protein
MQDEQQVQCLGRDRIHLQRLARHLEHHVQEARAVFEVVARIADRPADRIAVGGGGNRRHLGDQTDRRELALGRIVDVEGVVVERGQRTHRGHAHGHRVSVVMEALEEVLQRLAHHRVMRHFVVELGEFVGLGQFAVDQQIGNFKKIGMFRQLLDRIAAIQQDALVAVDERDRAFGCGGRHEARVVGEVAGVLVQLADVERGIAQRSGDDRQRGRTVGRSIGEDNGLLGHGQAPGRRTGWRGALRRRRARSRRCRSARGNAQLSHRRLNRKPGRSAVAHAWRCDFGPVAPAGPPVCQGDDGDTNENADPEVGVSSGGTGEVRPELLLGGVATVELVHAATGVDDLVLAGVERMRGAGNIDLDQRIFLAVFPFDLFLARHGGASQERKIGGDILEHHRVVLGMNVGFHGGSRGNVGGKERHGTSGPPSAQVRRGKSAHVRIRSRTLHRRFPEARATLRNTIGKRLIQR